MLVTAVVDQEGSTRRVSSLEDRSNTGSALRLELSQLIERLLTPRECTQEVI